MYDRSTEESKSLQSLLLEFLPPELEDLVQSFDLNRIKSSGTSIKQLAHQAALGNYLTYNTLSLADAAQFEDVKDLFEASYHARMLGCWDLAYILMCWPVGVNQTPLHKQLEKWGKHRQQIELYKGIYKQIKPTIDLLCLNGMGQAYRRAGDFKSATKYHIKQLEIAQKINNIDHQISANYGIGKTYYEWSDFKSAAVYFKQQFTLSKINNSIEQQVISLCVMGRSYINILKIRRGLKLLNQALKIANTIEDKSLQEKALSDLAYGYLWAGNIKKSTCYFEELVYRLSSEQNPVVYANTLRNLGQIYTFNGDDKALAYFEEVLRISEETNIFFLKIKSIADLALFYSQCSKDYTIAIQFAYKGLFFSQKNGYFRDIFHFRSYLGIFYADLGQVDKANFHAQELIRLCQTYPESMGLDQQLMLYACLGKVNWASGRRLRAVLVTLRSIIACPPWKSINGRWVLREMIRTLIQPFKNGLNRLKTKIKL